MFALITKHRGIWPLKWMCDALGVSRSGFHAWLNRPPSQRSRADDVLGRHIRDSFLASDRTYGARRVWRDVLAAGLDCGLHRIERLMREQGLRARPRRRKKPADTGERSIIADNVLDRSFEADAPNRKWLADFTYVWTAEGWLYVAVVLVLTAPIAASEFSSHPPTAECCDDQLSLPNTQVRRSSSCWPTTAFSVR
jgi:putative transposase